MGSLLVLAVGGLVAWAAIRLGMQRQETRLRAWRKAAADAGLQSIQERERFLGRELTGRAGTLSVRLERFKRGKGPSGTRIEIDGLEHGPFGLSFRREGLGTRLDRALAGERDIETGDPAFDREVFVSGQPAMARAVLGTEARRAVRWLLNRRIPLRDGASVDADVQVAYGKISVEVTESVFDDAGRPPVSGALLTSLLDAARLVAAPPALAEAIAKTAARDPVAGVRLACLRHLVEELPNDPVTRPALLRGRDDASVPVRLAAALGLGDDGLETLVEVARAPDAEDASRARAIEALGDRLPLDVAHETLARGVDGEHRASVLACVDALGRIGERAVGLLSDALSSPDGEIAVAAARALGLTGPAASPPLVAALASEELAVRVAAAESLGRVGSVECVPALRAAAERSGMARTVRQAVAEIHARLSGAEPGQLSLAAGGAGELSLAAEEAGALSVVDGERPAVRGDDIGVAARGSLAESEVAAPRPPQRPGTIQGKT
jgi:hypothetical protein